MEYTICEKTNKGYEIVPASEANKSSLKLSEPSNTLMRKEPLYKKLLKLVFRKTKEQMSLLYYRILNTIYKQPTMSH